MHNVWSQIKASTRSARRIRIVHTRRLIAASRAIHGRRRAQQNAIIVHEKSVATQDLIAQAEKARKRRKELLWEASPVRRNGTGAIGSRKDDGSDDIVGRSDGLTRLVVGGISGLVHLVLVAFASLFDSHEKSLFVSLHNTSIAVTPFYGNKKKDGKKTKNAKKKKKKKKEKQKKFLFTKPSPS